jgi:O-antigen chain-terminating methyltransferase
MMARTVSPDDLARLKADREEADRRYNEALTALDAAIRPIGDLPHPAPPPDETQVTPLNERWQILAEGDPPAAGASRWWTARLTGFVWRLVAPYLQRQQAFNGALVDHVNRNVEIGRATQRASAATLDFMRDRLHELEQFQSRLVVYLQQVTPFVDSKDHEFDGLTRRLHEDNRELFDLLDHRTAVLGDAVRGAGDAISGVGDELAKRWESMVVREQRYEARVSGLAAAYDELRGTLAIVHQAASTLKRELERLREAAGPRESAAARVVSTAAPSGAFEQARATSLDSFKYVGFEDRFRGSQEDIRGRLEEYLPYFEGAADVLDVGCGRGEFLDLLAARGISGRGVDLNHEMVAGCRERGLQVEDSDALGYLQRLPDASIGGLLAAQVVEHLQPDYLLAFIDAAYHKLRPGSRIVLETINPACWFAFFASYIRDITHVRPLHPDTLSYFVQASGFQRVSIVYRAPYPEHEKLQPVSASSTADQTINANVEKINRLLFTHLDYAVIGERL